MVVTPSADYLPVKNVVYKGPLLEVHQWQQPLPNGSSIPFERCIRPDTIAVIAFLDHETILLNEELPIDQTHSFFDVPGGRVDPGETAEHAAARELREETGYNANRLLEWHVAEYKGLIHFRHIIFVAKDLQLADLATQTSHDPTERITTHKISFEEAYQRSLHGELRRSEVMLAIIRMKHEDASKQRLASFLVS